jgi:hypothetical protein
VHVVVVQAMLAKAPAYAGARAPANKEADVYSKL